MAKIYHYTSIPTLALILNGKCIRFNRLDKVDDIEEAENKDLENFGQFCFVSCWTRDSTESIPLWNMYTPDMAGVRIGLDEQMFDPDYDINAQVENKKAKGLFDVPEAPLPYPELFEIEYVDKVYVPLAFSYHQNSEELFYVAGDRLGRIKNDHWSFQKECRFKLLARPNSEKSTAVASSLKEFSWACAQSRNLNIIKAKESLLFDLRPNILEDIDILLGPKASEAETLIVRSLLESNGLGKKRFEKSSLKIRKSK